MIDSAGTFFGQHSMTLDFLPLLLISLCGVYNQRKFLCYGMDPNYPLSSHKEDSDKGTHYHHTCLSFVWSVLPFKSKIWCNKGLGSQFESQEKVLAYLIYSLRTMCFCFVKLRRN